MENEEKAFEEARKNLEKINQEIENAKGLYQNVVIYLTDSEGNSLVKGTMEYKNLLALEKLHAAHSAEIVGMLFTALEDELKQKHNESKRENTEE